MPDTIEYLIDVLVCTYQRPEMLVKTLSGIKRAAKGLGAVRVIVVDNDVERSASDATRQWAQQSDLPVTYHSQPLQNISLTRNMALDNANAKWLALIDDDEIPDENWLHALLTTAQQYDADAVFGPVISVFEPTAPTWATKGNLFQRKRFPTGTSIPPKEARTGNVLLRGPSLARDAFRFDPELGLSGGEDSEFFARLYAAKYKMIWSDEAIVHEGTPPSRTRLAWILKRGFRIGSVEAYNSWRVRQLRKTSLGALKSLVFMVEGSALAIIWAPFSLARCVQGMRRAAMGIGFFYGLLGRPYSEYRTVIAIDKAAE